MVNCEVCGDEVPHGSVLYDFMTGHLDGRCGNIVHGPEVMEAMVGSLVELHINKKISHGFLHDITEEVIKILDTRRLEK